MTEGDMVKDCLRECLGEEAVKQLLLDYKYRDAVKRLASGITHSYNNIFTGVSGQLSMLLRDGDGSDQFGQRRQRVDELVQRGIAQTELFFEFCRYRKEEKRLCTPKRIAERVAALLNSLSRIHHIECRFAAELPRIKVNFQDLVLALFYLGENAIESMPDGGLIRLSVEAAIDQQGQSHVSFQVIDGGCGFGVRQIEEQPFVPFVDVFAGGRVRGLGLFAVNQIIEEQQGSLQVENLSDAGAKVALIVPAAEEVKAQSSYGSQVVEIHDSNSRQAVSRFMLMIVDDEESMRNILVDQLQRRGHVAFSVSSCEEALKEFVELSDVITAVLLDIGLQGTSGLECIQPLREIRDDITIILMSGENSDDYDMDLPGVYFLNKPFHAETVEKICRAQS